MQPYWTCSFQCSQELCHGKCSSLLHPLLPLPHPLSSLSIPPSSSALLSASQFLISHSEDTRESPLKTERWFEELQQAGSLLFHCSRLHFQCPRLVIKNHLQDDKRACCSLNSALIFVFVLVIITIYPA